MLNVLRERPATRRFDQSIFSPQLPRLDLLDKLSPVAVLLLEFLFCGRIRLLRRPRSIVALILIPEDIAFRVNVDAVVLKAPGEVCITPFTENPLRGLLGGRLRGAVKVGISAITKREA